jgi:cyclopropane fatty-acyl-phospholipid synthase-like methyltransferase
LALAETDRGDAMNKETEGATRMAEDNSAQAEVTRYSRRSILRSEWMYGHGLQAPGGLALVESFCQRLRCRPGMRVLDVGSGLGAADFHLASRDQAEVLGVDSSAVMVEISTERARAEGVHGVSFLHGDIRSVRLGMAFDLNWSRDCILYLSAAEKLPLWERLRSVLVPGGQLFVTDFCCGPVPHSLEFTRYVGDCQYHLSTIEHYVRLLAEAGFVAVRNEDLTEDFIKSMRGELARLEREQESFLREFTEADFRHRHERWTKKIQFCERGDLRWGLFLGGGPT